MLGGYAFQNNLLPLLPRDFTFIGVMATYSIFDGGKREHTRKQAVFLPLPRRSQDRADLSLDFLVPNSQRSERPPIVCLKTFQIDGISLCEV